MKTTLNYQLKLYVSFIALLCISFTASPALAKEKNYAQPSDTLFNSYRGVVTDANSREKLAYASLSVRNTNISIVSNADGEFLLKVPKTDNDKILIVSFLGYESTRIRIADLTPDKNKIELKALAIMLPELEVISKDPKSLIQMMLDAVSRNYSDKDMVMNAFYRETIRKRNTNVSLSEAIVEVYKQTYKRNIPDMVSLYKSRKSTDYSRLDTLVFKLMGGPFNSLYLDVMKYPDFIFTDDIFANYDFKFSKTDRIDDRLIYVIQFEPFSNVTQPLFYGNLYIDAQSYALVRAEFDMDLQTNNDEATRMFIRKKPLNARVSTYKAHYQIDYRLNEDKWYYDYSRIDLGMRINWKRKIFHTYYNSTIEMAATDWDENVDRRGFLNKERIHPTVVIQDAASGFSDPEFWGEHNIIEPDKSIENAIHKIQKNLKK